MNEFEIKILLSLFSLGLFGGFSHCGFMCGPFVLMQVNSNLKNLKIENITYLKKLKGLALIPYHLGRITTYSILGFICAFVGNNIRNNNNLNLISAIILFIGALLVFNLILKNFQINLFSKIFKKLVNFSKLNPFKNHFCKKYSKKDLYQKINLFFKKLFQNPRGLKGYFLGIILGFIPCGLLYSALIITATLDNYFLAFLAMLIFGLATIPALFLSAIGSYLFFSKMKIGFKIFSQFILSINMIMLLIMSLSQLILFINL